MNKLYITVEEAAQIAGLQIFTIYDAMRRNVLKKIKLRHKLHTTREWLHDYLDNRRNRSLHATFNGKKVYDSSRKEYSPTKAAQMLGINVKRLYYFIELGICRPIKRGSYHIITEHEILRLREDGRIFEDRRIKQREIWENMA